jgi:hypothetical protein
MSAAGPMIENAAESKIGPKRRECGKNKGFRVCVGSPHTVEVAGSNPAPPIRLAARARRIDSFPVDRCDDNKRPALPAGPLSERRCLGEIRPRDEVRRYPHRTDGEKTIPSGPGQQIPGSHHRLASPAAQATQL